MVSLTLILQKTLQGTKESTKTKNATLSKPQFQSSLYIHIEDLNFEFFENTKLNLQRFIFEFGKTANNPTLLFKNRTTVLKILNYTFHTDFVCISTLIHSSLKFETVNQNKFQYLLLLRTRIT